MSHIEIAKQSTRGTLLLFGGNVLSVVISAAAAVVMARLLGPASYGIYTLALVVPSLLYAFTGLGVNLAITRYPAYYISRGEIDRARSITKNAITFLLVTGSLMTVAVYFGGEYLAGFILQRSGLGPFVQLASLLLLGQTLLQSCISAFIGWQLTGLASISSVLQATVKLALSTTLILTGFGIYGAMIGHVGGYLGAGFVAVSVLYLTKLRGLSGHSVGFIAEIREMIGYGFPSFAGNVIVGLAAQYVTIVLALISANAVVGNYQAAVNVTAAMTVVSSAVSNSLFAGFSSLDGVKADTSLAFKYAVKYVSFVSIPIVVFLMTAAGVIFEVLYGPTYATGIPYLQLLALSNIPVAIGLSVTPYFFNGVGRTRLTMLFWLSGAISLATLTPLLGVTLGLGVPGLIYAQLASNLLSASLGLYLARRRLRASIDMRSSGLILLASLVALASTRILLAPFLPGVTTLTLYLVLFVAVYLTAIPIVRGLGHNDLDRLSVATEGIGFLKPLVRPILAYERRLLLKTGSPYPKSQKEA